LSLFYLLYTPGTNMAWCQC